LRLPIQFAGWWDSLTATEQRSTEDAVDRLAEGGPALGRPFVDTVKGSRHANMKELRPRGSTLRVLFAFNPRGTAILLIGGNKAHRWTEWYEQYIPVADALSDEHLRELTEEA